MMNKRLCIGFSVLEIAYWSFHASFICYASAYFLDNGVGNTTVSLLLAGYLLTSFIGSIIWGSACDALGTNKKVYIGCMLVSFGLMFLIYRFGANVAFLTFAYPLMGFFFPPQSPNQDAWLLASCRHDQKVFGAIRATPSFVYAFSAAAMGRLIASSGYSVMLIGATIFMAIALAAALYLPDVHTGSGRVRSGLSGRELAGLMKNKAYRKLIVLLFLIGLAIAPINNLKIVVLESVGGDVSHVGMDSFVSAMTQVPFFVMAGLISRIPLRVRYALMAALPLGMVLMDLFAVSPAMVIAGSFLYNAGFGILLPTMRDVTDRNVQESQRNLGHNLSDAVFNSFSGVVSLIYAGAVIDGMGTQAMLLLCAAIGAVPLAISLFSSDRA